MYQVSDQTGRRFVITGANSGTGKEATRRIAAAGGHVVMAVRTVEKGEAAAAEIRSAVPGASLEVRRVDLAEKLLVDRLHRTAGHADAEQADIAHVEIAITAGDADNHPFGIEVIRRDDAKFPPGIAPARLDRAAPPADRRLQRGQGHRVRARAA